MTPCVSKPEVFFDGMRPLCRHEINFYRRQAGAHGINRTDIRTANPSVLPHSLDKAQLLARFHMLGTDGIVQSGARAFIAIWL